MNTTITVDDLWQLRDEMFRHGPLLLRSDGRRILCLYRAANGLYLAGVGADSAPSGYPQEFCPVDAQEKISVYPSPSATIVLWRWWGETDYFQAQVFLRPSDGVVLGHSPFVRIAVQKYGARWNVALSWNGGGDKSLLESSDAERLHRWGNVLAEDVVAYWQDSERFLLRRRDAITG